MIQYRQSLLRGLQGAARKPTNLSKVSESPAVFLERLLEAYCLFTPINLEAPENRRAINIAFVTQSAPDIRKKLQKIEGFEGKNLSELVEIAQRVFNNRDDPETANTKRMTKVVIAALQENQRKPPTENFEKGQRGNQRPRKPRLNLDAD